MEFRSLTAYTCLGGALASGIPYFTHADDERTAWVPRHGDHDIEHLPERSFAVTTLMESDVATPGSAFVRDNASLISFHTRRRSYTIPVSGQIFTAVIDN